MNCRIVDLCNKEVVNIKNGSRLGFVCDVEVDTCTARLCSIVVYGRPKCFGLFGREDDIIINWCDIEVIGDDTILVKSDACKCNPCRRSLFESFFGKGKF